MFSVVTMAAQITMMIEYRSILFLGYVSEFLTIGLLVDLFPLLLIGLHHHHDVLSLREEDIRIDRLKDMEGVGLNESATIIDLVGITHGDEGWDDWDIVLRSEDESALLKRFWFAIIPPHLLLWVDEDEVAFGQDGIDRLKELSKDGWVRGKRHGVAVSKEETIEAWHREVAFPDDLEKLLVSSVLLANEMDRDAVKWREMVGGDDRAFLNASKVLESCHPIKDDTAFLDLVFEIAV